MFLSALRVLELNSRYNLVEGLSERELNNPEGVGLDLRVGAVYRFLDSYVEVPNEGLLGIKDRKMPKIEKIVDIKEDGEVRMIMKPRDFVLVETIEKITSPREKVKFDKDFPAMYLMPMIFPRTTLQRCGIALYRSKTDPGYSGTLTFALGNHGKLDFSYELGSRMFNLMFAPIIGEISRPYDGQHQGGRISSNGEREEQN